MVGVIMQALGKQFCVSFQKLIHTLLVFIDMRKKVFFDYLMKAFGLIYKKRESSQTGFRHPYHNNKE